MRYLLALLILSSAAGAHALDFDSFSKDNAVPTGLALRQNNAVVIKEMPLLDLLAEKDAAAKLLTLDGASFLASIVLDDNWDVYFQLKQNGSCANPGVWTAESLKDGVTFKYSGGEIKIKEENGNISLTGAQEAPANTSWGEMYDLLYAGSSRITFDKIVTYAVIRNLTPLSGNEGIMTMRMGSDGLYHYSLTPDSQVAVTPRWLVAVNSVLYGLKITDTDVVFLSKPSAQKLPPMERQLKL